jgi:hypothetical protein
MVRAIHQRYSFGDHLDIEEMRSLVEQFPIIPSPRNRPDQCWS